MQLPCILVTLALAMVPASAMNWSKFLERLAEEEKAVDARIITAEAIRRSSTPRSLNSPQPAFSSSASTALSSAASPLSQDPEWNKRYSIVNFAENSGTKDVSKVYVDPRDSRPKKPPQDGHEESANVLASTNKTKSDFVHRRQHVSSDDLGNYYSENSRQTISGLSSSSWSHPLSTDDPQIELLGRLSPIPQSRRSVGLPRSGVPPPPRFTDVKAKPSRRPFGRGLDPGSLVTLTADPWAPPTRPVANALFPDPADETRNGLLTPLECRIKELEAAQRLMASSRSSDSPAGRLGASRSRSLQIPHSDLRRLPLEGFSSSESTEDSEGDQYSPGLMFYMDLKSASRSDSSPPKRRLRSPSRLPEDLLVDPTQPKLSRLLDSDENSNYRGNNPTPAELGLSLPFL